MKAVVKNGVYFNPTLCELCDPSGEKKHHNDTDRCAAQMKAVVKNQTHNHFHFLSLRHD